MSSISPLADYDRLLIELARRLRERGVRIGTAEVLTAARALRVCDAEQPIEVRAALRCALCSSREEIVAFDEALAGRPLRRRREPSSPGSDAGRDVLAASLGVARAEREPPRERERPAWSDWEILRDRDLATLDPAQLEALALALRKGLIRLPSALRGTPRRSLRRTPRFDRRLMARELARHGGEPVRLRWQRPRPRPRRITVACDVSGSMRGYALAMLLFADALAAVHPRVEAFAFGTHLTRITPLLGRRRAFGTLAAAVERVEDWGGGTRIGEALGELNRAAAAYVGRGGDTVILSDGWDRGDPERLGEEAALLARRSRKLIWLSPFAATPGFEPLTGGLRAVMPHLDEFRPGHSLRSLEQLAELLRAA